MGKSRAYLVTLLAIWRLGAVHVPLFTAFAPSAITLRLAASRSIVIICDANQKNKLRHIEEWTSGARCRVVTVGAAAEGDTYEHLMCTPGPAPSPVALGGDAPIIQIYTSGTTGAPKGVVVPLRALAAFQIYAEYGLGVRCEDRFWNAADPGWAYGLYFGVLASLTTGVESFFYEGGFSPEATLEILRRFNITNFAAAPTVYRAIRHAGLQINTRLALRCASSAGEPLTPEVNEWAASSLGVEIHDHYGQTEVGMLINNHQHATLRRPIRIGSMGHVMPGWTAKILKVGADELASPGEVGRVVLDLPESPLHWFEGYVDEPAKSAEKFSNNGRWYITGDLARVDEDGYFYFSSRDDDVIIMAGYRIGPFEVESVILAHPAVSECAVVPVPDEIRGEVLEAVVVLAQGFVPSQQLTEEIQLKVKKDFAAHAYPRRVHYVETLPKTSSGKIQRFAVRQQLRDELTKSRSD